MQDIYLEELDIMKYTMRNIELCELKDIYKRIKQDFAKGEYAPYDVLYQQIQNGAQKGLILQNGKEDVAYAFYAEGKVNGYVLISLLAVYKEYRGKGFGTVFLEEFKLFCSDKDGIIVEVEKPDDAKTPGEKNIRIKRIHFYQNADFNLIPDIDYSIWDVSMHIMVMPRKVSIQQVNEEIGQALYEIYLELMGERYIHKFKFKSLREV